ncbi:MAG: putative metal-dependent hydrolase YfiT [Ignavibacteriaceae bacterium]|nr:putative metal-dependent hydrolase YfiT [Ignavibacteriaceae bacterium]
MDNEKLKYPIGRYHEAENIEKAEINNFIKEIETLPQRLADAVRGLSTEQLRTRYRPDGWTIQQVVHHIADSHLNAYVRFKLALTEDNPVIKPYNEKLWAELPDSKLLDINVSLTLIDSLHKRWTALLKQLNDNELEKKFLHPDSGMKTLSETVCQYAWHGNHHLAHIISLKEKMKW